MQKNMPGRQKYDILPETFFCFFRSPVRFKDKEKKSRSDFSSLRDFYLLDLSYSALYLADVAIY